MEIRQLEYFLMVSKLNSFTRAAERLYVSQPAVTNAIRSLEDELGLQLLDRTQKKVVVTTEGQIFLRHVETVLQGISNSLTEIDALKNLNGGLLRIGITSLAGINPTVELIKNFHETYPQIQISFYEQHSGNLEEALLEDVIDIAFLFTSQKNSNISYLPLPTQELYVCCSNDHPLTNESSINLADLDKESLIVFASDCLYRQQIISAFESINTLPEILFESDHIQTIKSFIATNMGISILPKQMSVNESILTGLPLDPSMYITPSLAFKTNRYPSRAAQAFINQITKEVHNHD